MQECHNERLLFKTLGERVLPILFSNIYILIKGHSIITLSQNEQSMEPPPHPPQISMHIQIFITMKASFF